jgi:hypothetical protein
MAAMPWISVNHQGCVGVSIAVLVFIEVVAITSLLWIVLSNM